MYILSTETSFLDQLHRAGPQRVYFTPNHIRKTIFLCKSIQNYFFLSLIPQDLSQNLSIGLADAGIHSSTLCSENSGNIFLHIKFDFSGFVEFIFHFMVVLGNLLIQLELPLMLEKHPSHKFRNGKFFSRLFDALLLQNCFLHLLSFSIVSHRIFKDGFFLFKILLAEFLQLIRLGDLAFHLELDFRIFLLLEERGLRRDSQVRFIKRVMCLFLGRLVPRHLIKELFNVFVRADQIGFFLLSFVHRLIAENFVVVIALRMI